MARVVLTQSAPRVHALAARLRDRGHDALALPLSRVVECLDDAPVRAIRARLRDFDWVVLVSPAAVRAAARIASSGWPESTGVAVVGPGSLQAIVDSGLPVDSAQVLSPRVPPFDADALSALAPLNAPAGLRVLVLRGTQGSDQWIERLRAGGATVETCALYRHEPVEADPDALETLREWLADTPKPVFLVTQVPAVNRLEATLQRARLREVAHAACAFAIHPRIVAALRDAAWTNVRAIEPGDRALEHALESASDWSSPHGV